MKKLRDIMRSGFLFMVPQDAMVVEAVRMMATHNIGIVIAMDGAQPAGVFSERDVVRRVVEPGLEPTLTPIRDVMTTDIITADADEDYQAAMRKMDQANIRHLLVVSEGRLLSMISIRDLIRVDMADKSAELRYLREYLYQV
jgi:CBS domain-containing protein